MILLILPVPIMDMFGYSIVTATLLVTFGRLSDIHGRVKLYNLGFAIFTVGSILLSVTPNKLRSNMENLKILPARLGVGVMITFALYCSSVIVDSLGLVYQAPFNSGYFPAIFFIMATGTFFVVGVVEIVMVFVPMVNEFEAITKRQKKVSSKNHSTASQKASLV